MLLHITSDDEMTKKRWFIHYEKLHWLKPHYPIIKIQKTTCIQLLCNYPLGITTTV
jgi:hypothetical protein